MRRHPDFVFAHELNLFRLHPQHISVHLVMLHEEKRKVPALRRDWIGDRLYSYIDQRAALAFVESLRRKYGGSVGPLRDKIEEKYKLVGERNRKRFHAMTPEYARESILALQSRALTWAESLPPGLDPQEVADKTGLTGTVDYWKGMTRHFRRYRPHATVESYEN